MQIVKIVGGLGNQMFAYAFALALRALGREVALDLSWHERNEAHNGWELDRIFRLELPLCSAADRDRLGDVDRRLGHRLRRKLLGPRKGHYREGGSGFDPRYIDITGDAYFDGFWQSSLYHAGIEAEIDRVYSFPPGLEPESRTLFDGSGQRTTIGVHVRRGDYLGSDLYGGVCTEAYFTRAIERVLADAADPILLFFSDDLDWCRETLGSAREAVFVDWNRGGDSWRDLRLMTRCDRLVLSNSSFSWWGTRLDNRPKRGDGKIIVAPSRWYGLRYADNTAIAAPGWVRIGPRGEA